MTKDNFTHIQKIGRQASQFEALYIVPSLGAGDMRFIPGNRFVNLPCSKDTANFGEQNIVAVCRCACCTVIFFPK